MISRHSAIIRADKPIWLRDGQCKTGATVLPMDRDGSSLFIPTARIVECAIPHMDFGY